MRPAFFLIPLLLLLGSCGSPPKPPRVDESVKRPANSAISVELQVCKSNLQNTHILATESSRLAEIASANLERVSARQQAIAARAALSTTSAPANSIFTIHFEFGSTRVAVPVGMASPLVDNARIAPLVVLRGRTDGASDSAAESHIARARAAAVRDYLVGAGVDPARIRATYQPAGDHTADNSSPSGRGMNRRVEIEVYRALPVAMNATTALMP